MRLYVDKDNISAQKVYSKLGMKESKYIFFEEDWSACLNHFKIGNIQIDTPVLLAPMAGVTDYSFRILCKEQGAGIVYSEFVSAHGIIRENEKSLDINQIL